MMFCYVESGYPPQYSLVKSRQRRFFSKIKMWKERQRMQDDPFVLLINIAMENHYQTRGYIENLLHIEHYDISEGLRVLKANI